MENETKDAAPVQAEDENFLDVLGNMQLTKKIIKAGEDSRPEKGCIATINIKEMLEDSTIISEKQNFVIQVGDVEVVQGKESTSCFSSFPD